jgi:hypothetical protein
MKLNLSMALISMMLAAGCNSGGATGRNAARPQVIDVAARYLLRAQQSLRDDEATAINPTCTPYSWISPEERSAFLTMRPENIYLIQWVRDGYLNTGYLNIHLDSDIPGLTLHVETVETRCSTFSIGKLHVD